MNSLKHLKNNFSTMQCSTKNACSTNISSCSRTSPLSKLWLSACNYPQYINLRFSNYESKWKMHNHKAFQDLKAIHENQKHIAEKTWKLEENSYNHTSSLHREFTFNSTSSAITYMNIVKEKFDEVNHHPEWTLDNVNNKLSVNLTSHYAKNNVTVKDYELAAFMNYQYEERCSYSWRFDFFNQKAISFGAAALLFAIGLYGMWYVFVYEKNFNVSSHDFLFAKIHMNTNDRDHKGNFENKH
jgi:4a-hydroxytetrahydrobiopterin dehydratase